MNSLRDQIEHCLKTGSDKMDQLYKTDHENSIGKNFRRNPPIRYQEDDIAIPLTEQQRERALNATHER